jgi:hypothetical protein
MSKARAEACDVLHRHRRGRQGFEEPARVAHVSQGGRARCARRQVCVDASGFGWLELAIVIGGELVEYVLRHHRCSLEVERHGAKLVPKALQPPRES